MNDRPIIFSAKSVRAILDGRKTQTRRVIKPQPPVIWDICKPIVHKDGHIISWCFMNSKDPDYHGYPKKPKYKVGDLLWVRETFRYGRFALGCGGYAYGVEYKTGGIKFTKKARKYAKQRQNKDKNKQHARWRSPIFMPKWAARIWLEITNIRVERVQDISEEEVQKEGWPRDQEMMPLINTDYKAKRWFQALWDSLNAERGFGWYKNPRVWVIEFKRIQNDPAKTD